MDMLYWLLGCAAAGSARPAHVPRDISSAGQLQFFRRERKPADAGAATNCLACAHEPACQFSARRVYTGRDLAGRQQSHFAGIVAPAADIEEAQPMGAQAPGATAALLAALAEDYDAATTPAGEVAARNWYGRCVWEADNDVCDNQTVTLSWDSEPLPDVEGGLEGRGCKTATLHMVAFTEKICQRFTHIYGVHGEMYADSSSIQVTDFRRQGEGATTAADRTKTYYPHVPEDGGHGDGDAGLTRQFVLAVDRVKNGGVGVAQAQREYMGCELRDIIMSHSMVFAAEEARTEKRVVDFQAWWDRKVASRLELSSGPGSGTS